MAYAECLQIPGGLHDEREADEKVERILNQMRREFEERSGQRFSELKALSYRKQTVAGNNYFIKVLAVSPDGVRSHHHLRIYEPINGPMELTAIRTNLERSQPLHYFQ